MPRRYLQSPLAGRIQHYNHNGPDVEIVVMIPSGSIGVLIGKKGEHITRIRRHCVGVKIEISSEWIRAPILGLVFLMSLPLVQLVAFPFPSLPPFSLPRRSVCVFSPKDDAPYKMKKVPSKRNRALRITSKSIRWIRP